MLIDLSHVIEEGMPVYPGIPAPSIGVILNHQQSRERYQGKAEFFIGAVDLPGNTGTYLDTPFHRYADEGDLAAIPLDRIATIPGLIVDAAATAGPIDVVLAEDAARGRAVLVRTGWNRRWGTDAYWEPGPYLSQRAIDLLVRAEAALVGVDFANVDDIAELSRPAHTGLLGAGILIVEHLTGLEALPNEGFTFTAAPPRIVGGASFPVRAFAEVPTAERGWPVQ